MRKNDKRRLFADLPQLRSDRLLRLRREKQENLPVLLFGFGFYRLTKQNDRQTETADNAGRTEEKSGGKLRFAAAFLVFKVLRDAATCRGAGKYLRNNSKKNLSGRILKKIRLNDLTERISQKPIRQNDLTEKYSENNP